jgi:pSer/pThr/pTyr-binding forkhead associated (FHA) protein
MSKDLFHQDTGVFQCDEDMATMKNAKIDAKSSMPRLEVRGQSKLLSNKVISIGRDKSNQLIIADKNVSRFHAIVNFENDVAYIKDTNSTNGTYINDKQIPTCKKIKLNNGDKIKVGNTVILFYT